MGEKEKGLENLLIWKKTVDYAVDVCQNLIPYSRTKKMGFGISTSEIVQSIQQTSLRDTVC